MSDQKTKAPAEAAAVEDGRTILPLTKPVKAHNEELTQLVAREPTGSDYYDIGNPVSVDFTQTPPALKIDDKKMLMMISTLCSVPLSTVKMIKPRDLSTISIILSSFFIPDTAQL